MCTAPAGDKYSHAKKWKIPCVTSSWVLDSTEAGYCLPTESYRVEKTTKSSTPTKQDQTQARLDEVSMCETILNPDETLATRQVEDTINSTAMLGKTGLTGLLLLKLSLTQERQEDWEDWQPRREARPQRTVWQSWSSTR